MKKLLFAALIAVSISTGSFAQDATDNYKALNNFEASFTGANNVGWTLKDNLTVASFVQDESNVKVFYNSEGDFVATTKEVTLEDLPIYAKRIIAKKYSGFIVKEAFKFKADNETDYFIAVENEQENVVLKVHEGSISVYSKTGKS
jgi:hypothetical protein